ncbi:hypothetical protein LTR33_012694 [Friedmanniomyces endolithicus]|nr:hypothetical protein LTR33_012694 [Friedmanniomyces endolithicus]
MVQDDEIASFEVYQDSVSTTVIAKLAPSPKGSRRRVAKGRKNEIKPVVKAQTNDDDGDDARELSDFVEFLAEEIFASLPSDLRSLSYAAIQDDPSLKTKYEVPLATSLLIAITDHLPPTTADSLQTYALIPDSTDLDRFLEPILESTS